MQFLDEIPGSLAHGLAWPRGGVVSWLRSPSPPYRHVHVAAVVASRPLRSLNQGLECPVALRFRENYIARATDAQAW